MIEMKELRVRVTFIEELLGTASANPELHSEFIASKAPDAMTRDEEVAALGAEAVEEKGMTVFPRDAEGNPILWDYQIKGFFKGTVGFLRRVPGTKASKIKSYKKVLDGLMFVQPRQIVLEMPGELGNCQRPLWAETLQGERVALANSETAPAGTEISFSVLAATDEIMDAVREALDYGAYTGMGQWRNSGKGRFLWTEIE